MQTANQYINELQEGAKIQGQNLSTQWGYYMIAVGTQGPTQVNLFSSTISRNTTGVTAVLGVTGTNTGLITSATAPTNGTITGFFVTNAATAGGTFTLWATTSGTVATIPIAGTLAFLGSTQGTTVLNAAFAAGDTVFVKGVGSGTVTAYVTFQTQN